MVDFNCCRRQFLSCTRGIEKCKKKNSIFYQLSVDRKKIIVGNTGLTFGGSPNHILLPKTLCQKVTNTIVCHYHGPIVVLLWCYCGVERVKNAIL